MQSRLDYYQASPETVEAISALSDRLSAAFPDPKLRALVELRVSQLNGCAYCVDLHSEEARKLGETVQRLDCLVVWRDVPFFTPRERAALGWAEAVTLVAQTHVPDEAFAEVSDQFPPEDVVKLTAVIGVMNLWNRVSVSFRGLPSERPA